MKKHTKLYLKYFGYATGDFIPSEITGTRAVDIHHIESRKMGGSKSADTIDNLMAVTRSEHLYFGDKTQYLDFLKRVHASFLETELPWIETHPKCETLKSYLHENG